MVGADGEPGLDSIAGLTIVAVVRCCGYVRMTRSTSGF